MQRQESSTTTVPAPSISQRAPTSFTDQLVEPLSRLRTEVDRLFNDFPFRMPFLRFGLGAAMAPALEMSETKKAYKISAELPGMDSDAVDVSVENGMLRISGEKKEEREEDEAGYRLSERSYGSFERLVSLPDGVDADQIKARCRNGVLTISIPKDEKAARSARRIPVDRA